MTQARSYVLFLGIAIAGVALGVLAQRWYATSRLETVNAQLAEPTPAAGVVKVGDHRPDFSLADLEGRMRSISEWDDQVVLLNFWATWCAPCRKEMPELAELHHSFEDQGFAVVGIAIDSLEPVQAFITELGVDYPMLIGELDAIEVARTFGNRLGVLPYSVILDRRGSVVLVRAGEIQRALVVETITPLLGAGAPGQPAGVK